MYFPAARMGALLQSRMRISGTVATRVTMEIRERQASFQNTRGVTARKADDKLLGAHHFSLLERELSLIGLPSALLDTISRSLFTPRSEEVPTHEIQATVICIGCRRSSFFGASERSASARIVTQTNGDG